MDQMDEFEFKPLNEGLGFHKKPVSLKDEMQKAQIVSDRLGAQIPNMPGEEVGRGTAKRRTYQDLLEALEKPLPKTESKSPFHPGPMLGGLEITETLPREKRSGKAVGTSSLFGGSQTAGAVANVPRVDTLAAKAAAVAGANFDVTAPSMPAPLTQRSGHDAPATVALEAAAVSFSSMFLDSLVVMSMTLIFLLSVLMITQVDLLNVVLNTQADFLTQVSLVMLFVSVMQMYVVVARSFFGRTLGEWTFDHQMGSDEDHKSAIFPLRVALRSLVITVTGVVTLPIISWITGRDLAGNLSGLQLYRQRF